jgi:hypothetical protein
MDPRRRTAVELMERFAQRTGLTAPDQPSRRYLWTDAFAVCTFLGIGRALAQTRYTEMALQLVDRVHHVLGRHRPDDARTGWLSGLSAAQGEAHPTIGGLRIGKPLPERAVNAPLDERLEWDRDGQYFHYLTKWMHALDVAARSTGQLLFNRWACELAVTAHRAFTYVPRSGQAPRMHWKMSIDLARPLVASMGQHDPLDGLITCIQLETTTPDADPSLQGAMADYAAMLDGLASADPLGIGGILVDAFRLAQVHHHASHVTLIESLLDAALVGVRGYLQRPDLGLPATHRLAFRELGLAIGLAALSRDPWPNNRSVRVGIERLRPFADLGTEIERFWCHSDNRSQPSWIDHADINDVMLATALEPEGFLALTAARVA